MNHVLGLRKQPPLYLTFLAADLQEYDVCLLNAYSGNNSWNAGLCFHRKTYCLHLTHYCFYIYNTQG
ncbi:hypothetical protein GDO78_000019 [Eleutherodactylus coqui]|uniref:Uncharacterized protein n=1 Tax=Eleutherodactylus coqui TaxID=57060 RepID=A0A8J6KH10_ELECQ|nr:hypothetical protein GDO78_000019 [Eleutherodactylus coqui]